MLIIHKYLFWQIARYFLMVLAVCIGLYLAVDFFERIDNFVKVGLPLTRALIYFQAKIPFILSLIVPLAVLLAVLITFGLMHRSNELTALKAGGVSTYSLIKLVLLIGVGFSMLMFVLTEAVLPVAKTVENRIWLQEVKREKMLSTREQNIWIKGNRQITHIRYYHHPQRRIFDITSNFFDDTFRVIRRVDARRGEFVDGRWVLFDVIEQKRNPQTGDFGVTFHDQQPEHLDFMPADLQRVAKRSEEMNLRQLWGYIRRIEAEGYDAGAYRVDLHAKIAYPLVCVIMAILGSGIALKGYKQEGLAVAIALGIGTAFSYWIVYSFCLSLGYGEMLPPYLAAWMANLMYMCFGCFVLLNAE